MRILKKIGKFLNLYVEFMKPIIEFLNPFIWIRDNNPQLWDEIVKAFRLKEICDWLERKLTQLSHINKRYYYGRDIRWLIEDKHGKKVYCDKCGNLANGIEQGHILGLIYRIPLCKVHLKS